MTHGGLNSVQEAIYHKVPLLGFPFGTDQKLNMRRAINDGYARQILWKEVSEESLSEAIGDMLHNPRYGIKSLWISLLLYFITLFSLQFYRS